MKLHDSEALRVMKMQGGGLIDTLARTRVPGGWLYTITAYTESPKHGVTLYRTTTFVPLHDEGRETDDE